MEELVNYYAEYFRSSGINPMMGQIFGLLLAKDEPVSLGDIARELNLSKPAISIQVRQLNRLGYCRKIPRSSDRKDYYVVNEKFTEAVQGQVLRDQEYHCEELNRILEQQKEALSPQVRARLENLTEFSRFKLEMLEELLKRWKEYNKNSENSAALVHTDSSSI